MSLLQRLPNRPTDKVLHVVLIVGTRPEAIKLTPVAVALQARPEVKVSIWCSGQHPMWAIEMLAHFGLTVDRIFDLSPQPPGLAQVCSAMLAYLRTAFETEHSDVVLVQGDTSSVFARALAAAYSGIPLAHIEAGLRSNNRHMPFPEESHRRTIANFTSLHCTPTQIAADALLTEGVADILQCGNPVIDALQLVQRGVEASDLFPEVGRLRYPQFMRPLRRATLVMTDSGGIQEEAAALGTPLLVLRNTTERPERIDTGTARLVGTTEQAIVVAAGELLDSSAELTAMRVPCTLYGDGNAAVRIASAVLDR